IFNHEIAHVKEKHSYDKIFLNLVLIFFWINPFFWLMRKELYMIHEFVADKEALEDSDINAFAEMILQTVYPGQNFSITNSFFYSPLKRRIMMLTKNKNPKVSYLSRLLVLPLAAIVFFAFTLKVHSTDQINSYHGKTITVVIDAGHGGNDNGATINGLNEKDITLSIAKKIAALNSNDRIKILLSREDDQTISVKDRVLFAKEKKADLFISLHLNAAANKQLDGFSVLIDKENSPENILLGSALIDELKKSYQTDEKIGVRKNGIWVLDENVCPAALIECGFLSNPTDEAFITDKDNQQKIATNILNAIENYATQNYEKGTTGTISNEEADKPVLNLNHDQDTVPDGKLGGGAFVDAKEKFSIKFDKLIQTTSPEKTKINPMKAVLVINGKIEPNSILKTKTISAGTLTIHSGDEKDMIAKYGDAAKNGVFVLDDAVIKNTPPVFSTGKPSNDSNKIFTKVENEASFPGGQSAWLKYITHQIQASIDTFTNADYGTCVIRFIVKTDGTVTDVVATTMKNTSLAKVSINAIKNGPKWIPAQQNGHTVASFRLQPVTLTNPEKPNQTSGSDKPGSGLNDDRKIFVRVEQSASFPGGQTAWLKYLSRVFDKNGNELMSDKNNEGTCEVRFIVSKDGDVSEVQPITKKGTKLADVAVNAIKKGPMWIPGKQNGHNVNSFVTVPVTFKLSDGLIIKNEPQ
ncbi:MAG TPA: N-acetylmuramoyl-L-alanine amidase, partial [Hanamia sp.]|nr:N-acetylmuramoyl-L-alanine amidase [Hanamia sp.]